MSIPRNNTVVLSNEKLVSNATNLAMLGDSNGARMADIELIRFHMPSMSKVEAARAEVTISKITQGKRRYNFEIPPIAQAR